MRNLLNHFPRMKALIRDVLQQMFPSMWVSGSYVEMSHAGRDAEAEKLRMAWTDRNIPIRQRELVDQQLAAYKRGGGNVNFDVLVKALKESGDCPQPVQLLEVGCSSGYYSEVFDIAGLDISYTGCDYSDAFIAMARQYYPERQFDVQDATALGYAENTYDVVISGCCLLHIPEYQIAVAEAARVASRYVIFHRTPVVLGQPDKYYRKKAYGVETVEIHFNEPQFLQRLTDNGLELLATHTLDETVSRGVGNATRTYMCRKKTT